MEPVPSLKAASLCKLAEEIWRSWNVSSLLTNYAYKDCKRKCGKAATYDAQKAYHALLEKVISNIMIDNNIPEPYKVDAAMAFIELEQNMLTWGKKIQSHLVHKTKANIEYCLEKTSLTQNGKINRPRTLIKAMFDSFAKIQFEGDSVSLACKVTKNDFENFIWSEKYVKDQYWRLREKVERQMKGMNSGKTWEPIIDFLLCCHGGNASEAQIILESVTIVSPDLWLHLVETRGLGSQKFFCLALVETLLSNKRTKQEKTNIIMNIHKQLEEELWHKILIKYFQEIITPLFMSSYREYSLKFFNQVCHEIEEKTCADTLKHLLDQMINVSQTYRCESIYFLKCKEIFLKMWNNSPLNAKTILGKDMMKILRELLMKNDFYFMSLLINDDAFNYNQKKGFIMFIILDLVSELELSKVDQFLQELPDGYNVEFAKMHAKDNIKKYIGTKQHTLNYDAIFEFTFKTKAQANAFRIEMFSDKDFLTDALASLAISGNLDEVKDFLKWGFNNDEIAINKFIDEKLKTEHWLVEIYKKYLSNVMSNLKHPKPFLLHCFLPDLGTQIKFKRCVREDEEFVLSALDKMIVENLSSLTSFLRCIFDKTEKKERVKLVMNYFRSKRGLNCICDMIFRSATSSAGFAINNVALYHRHKIDSLIQQCFKFKKHWFVCENMYDVLSWAMRSTNSDDLVEWTERDLKQRVEVYKNNKREVLLPHEDVKALGKIVLKSTQMFFCLIRSKNLDENHVLEEVHNPPFLFKTEDLI